VQEELDRRQEEADVLGVSARETAILKANLIVSNLTLST
jgi:hypothetical protein